MIRNKRVVIFISLLIFVAMSATTLLGCGFNAHNIFEDEGQNADEGQDVDEGQIVSPPEEDDFPEAEEFIYIDNADGSVTICGYRGPKSELFEIPKEINGKPVTEIGDSAFASTFISGGATQRIFIPYTVKRVGYSAFRANSGIKQIVFGEGSMLKEICDSAFSGCSSLASIQLPCSVEHIGGMAFAYCISLGGTFVLPSSVKYVSSAAFASCGVEAFMLTGNNDRYEVVDGILYEKNDSGDTIFLCTYPAQRTDTSFVVPDIVLSIETCAFYGNKYITRVDLNNVTELREKAFYDCSNLETIISDKLHLAEGYVFDGTEWLKNNYDFGAIYDVVCVLGGSVAEVDLSGYFSVSSFAAKDNLSIKSVTFNNAARNIGSFAFSGCENLETVYLNNLNDIVYVGTGAFDGVADNFKIYVPRRVLEEYLQDEIWQQYIDKIEVHSTFVEYVLNGGNVDGQKEFSGKADYGGYMSLPVPERDGYIFDGWYLSPDFRGEEMTDYTLWTSYADSTTMYAKWVSVNSI